MIGLFSYMIPNNYTRIKTGAHVFVRPSRGGLLIKHLVIDGNRPID